jgi:hypothetical protein
VPGRPTIVTAADHRFARTLWQFLASAERQGLQLGHDVVAVDLGLTPADRARLVRRFPWCQRRAFDVRSYPPHVRDLTNFAWKPILLADLVAACQGALVWFDSATLFHGPLDAIAERVERCGIFVLAGQTALGDCCDPRTLAMLDVHPDDLRKPYRAGGAIGLDPKRPWIRELTDRWRACALVPHCIAPPGLDRRVHRFDQAILTALIARAEREHGIVVGADEIDISSTNPAPWISTRNKVPAWMPTVMDPLVRAYYAAWKRADRAVLRARRGIA